MRARLSGHGGGSPWPVPRAGGTARTFSAKRQGREPEAVDGLRVGAGLGRAAAAAGTGRIAQAGPALRAALGFEPLRGAASGTHQPGRGGAGHHGAGPCRGPAAAGGGRGVAPFHCVFRPIVTGDFGIVTAHFGR
jgi:hypothetical protein